MSVDLKFYPNLVTILDRMVRDGLFLISSAIRISSIRYYFLTKDGKAIWDDPDLDSRKIRNIHLIHQKSLLVQVDLNRRAWYETAYQINDKGRKYLESVRPQYEDYKKTQAEKARQIDRLVIISNSSRAYFKGTMDCWDPMVGHLCRIVGETPKRFQVEIVRKYDYYNEEVIVPTSRETVEVAKDSVLYDPATLEMWKSLVEIDVRRAHDRQHLIDQKQDEIAKIVEPIEKRYQDRLDQMSAMYDEMISEATRKK